MINQILFIIAFTNYSFCLEFLCPTSQSNQNFTCQIDHGSYIQEISTKTSDFVIAEYNVDRNGYGGDSKLEEGLGKIIAIFKDSPRNKVPLPDIIMLSEMARDCKSYGNYMNGPDELAKALNMSYSYAVEFVELDESTEDHQCTIGNAILSTYPQIYFDQIRFKNQCCMFPHRLGGRIATHSIIQIDSNLKISILSTHLESGTGIQDQLKSMEVRNQQVDEMIIYQQKLKNTVSVKLIGGDFNAPMTLGSTIIPLILTGYVDSHKIIPFYLRGTCPLDPLSYIGLDVFIIFLVPDQDFYGLKRHKYPCYGASDHIPIWTSMAILPDDGELESKTK